MKKVTFEPQSTVSIDNITDDANIGIEWRGGKGFLVRREDSSFIPVNIIDSAIWASSNASKTKQGCLKDIKTRHNVSAFSFSSMQELLQWAAE